MARHYRKIFDRPKLVSLAVILAWIALLSYLVISGKYSLYLHPNYMFLPVFATLVLLGMAGRLVASIRVEVPYDDDGRPSADYNGENHMVLDPMQRLMLLFLPVFVFMLMGAQTLRHTSANSGSSSGTGDVGEFEVMIPPDADRIVDDAKYPEVNVSEVYVDKGARRLNMSVRVIGMVSGKKYLPKGMYALDRMLIICCAVCAQPVSFPIMGDFPDNIRPGDWAWVYGILRKAKYRGETVYFIEAERVIPAARPKSPYLY